jgi:biotin transport system substrate-specific component
MQNEISLPLVPATARQLAWLRRGGIVIGGSALVALCSHIALPLYYTPVPLTLQPFAVLLLGLLLAPRLAAATLTAYLAEGAMGLPVFTPSVLSGIAHLIGPTGGYLFSYPLAAALVALLWQRSTSTSVTGKSFYAALWAAAAGNLLILSCGAVWMALWLHASARVVLTESVLPFLPGDALKVMAAAALAAGWTRLRRRNA